LELRLGDSMHIIIRACVTLLDSEPALASWRVS
jgi:hypothetical protein